MDAGSILQRGVTREASGYRRSMERPDARVGQIYNGDFLRAIFWLIVTPGLWIGTGGMFGWICHVIAAMTAYHRANTKNRALAA